MIMRRLLLVNLILVLVVFSVMPALAESGKISASIYGGWAFPLAGDAIKGRDGDSGPDSSSFDNTWTLGAEAAYRFPSGLSLGVGLGYLSLDANASRTSGGSEKDWSTLKLTPLYLLVKYDHPLAQKLSWYGEAGLAYAFASADEGEGMKAMAQAMGGSANASASDAPMLMLGTGLNYFFASPWSLNLGVRYWWGEFDTDLEVSGAGVVSKNKFDAQNFQILAGISYWFSL